MISIYVRQTYYGNFRWEINPKNEAFSWLSIDHNEFKAIQKLESIIFYKFGARRFRNNK